MSIEVETSYEIYDQDGNKVVKIGNDKDGLGLVRVVFNSEYGQYEYCMDLDVAIAVANTITRKVADIKNGKG